MISANRVYLATAPWTVFFPGCMIVVTVLCCTVVGDALRDMLGGETKERLG